MMPYLESSSKSVDTIVCLLRWKTLECEEDSLGLFGDQVIGSVIINISAQLEKCPKKLATML
jgi:hypothetical protein